MEAFWDRQERFLRRFPTLRSILIMAIPYYTSAHPKEPPPRSGKIARYAWGRDYHRVIKKRLKKLEAFIRSQVETAVRIIRSIDTSPIQERALAEASGLGFIGKNSCLILPRGGSFYFLATLLTDLELAADEPIDWDCGACTLCLEACPTQALVRPYQLDAGRCISNLTIEWKEPINPALRPLMKDWIFGCDICQEVCPYNRKSDHAQWAEFLPIAGAGSELPLKEILGIRTDEAFLERFAGTPLMRAKRVGLLRNAAVVAGNLKDPELIPALTQALQEDPSSIVREHAAWALAQITA